MTNVYHLEPRQTIREEASIWIIKLDDGSYNKTELIGWMQRSPYHAETLFELASTWDNMDILSNLSDIFPLSKKTSSPAYAGYAIAASVVIAVIVFIVFNSIAPIQPAPQEKMVLLDEPVHHAHTYETAVGENSTINLPDNTTINLNTSSRIMVHYTDQHRFIDLLQGEAHFDVAHDPQRPLSVTVAGKVIRAVGTAFNIELTPDNEVKVLVTGGEVIIGDKPADVRVEEMHFENAIPLSQGEMIIIGDNDKEVIPVDGDKLEQNLSWMDGNLIFEGEPLEIAIEEISRYTNIRFQIVDDDIKKIKLAGLFKAGDIDGLLFALRENFQISHKRTGQDSIVLGEATPRDQ